MNCERFSYALSLICDDLNDWYFLQKGDTCSPTENGHKGSEDEADASEDEADGLVDVEDLGQVVASKVREN